MKKEKARGRWGEKGRDVGVGEVVYAFEVPTNGET